MVRYRTRAQEDINTIYTWIARDNEQAAQRVEDAIRAAGALLGERPELGVATGHRGTRRWPMPQFDYTIFYLIDWQEDAIDVLRVVDGKRVHDLKRVPR